MAESAARCAEMLAEALGVVGAASRSFAETAGSALAGWPGNAVLYAFSRSHHRGQVCMLAHQLGFPLPDKVAYGIWNWEKLWRECGSSGGLAPILKESLKGTGRPGATMVETSSPSHWGCCRSSGRRQRSEAGARIPRVRGRCRNVARAITIHRLELWA